MHTLVATIGVILFGATHHEKKGEVTRTSRSESQKQGSNDVHNMFSLSTELRTTMSRPLTAMLRSAAAHRPAALATVSSSLSNVSHASCSSRSFSCLVLKREHSQNILGGQRRLISTNVASSYSQGVPVILTASDGQQSNYKNNSSGHSGGGSGNFGRGGNNNHRNNHEVPTCAYISALAAIMGLYVLSHIDDEAEHAVMSTETTWVDLLQLVHDDKVDRIVVTDNNTVARIYVMEESSRSNEDGKEKERGHAQNLSNNGPGNNVIDEDTTQMQLGDSKSKNEESTKTSSIPWSSSNFHHDGIEAPSRNSPAQSPKVYRLSIDTSFEEKLEDAQRKYGRNRTNFIPVQYTDSVTDESPVLTAAARIALIGVVSGMIRIITKQPGAGFGSSAELGSSLGIIANSSFGTSLAQLRRMKALGVAMVPLLTRLPSSWTKAQQSNSWKSLFTYSRK